MDGPSSRKRKRSAGDDEAESAEGTPKRPRPETLKSANFDVDKLKKMLDTSRASEASSPATSSTPTPTKAQTKLKASRFRFLNEQLYTQTGAQSFKMFRRDPEAFRAYHEGYMEQVAKWPQGEDPLAKIIGAIMKR